jgi:tetratricopeptide (TPR) repeat protein
MSDPSADIIPLVGLLQAGRHAELELAAREFLTRNPDAPLAWQLLALALARQGKDPLPAWQRAVELAPEDPIARHNLGNALARAGQLAAAAASFREAIARRPDLADAHASLGLALAGLTRDEEAIAALLRARALDPENAQTCLTLAGVLRRNGRLDEAEASLRAVLARSPQCLDALVGIATVLRLQRRAGAAEAACAEALALAPQSVAALTVKAELRADLGDFAGAEALYREIIGIEPAAVAAWAGLAQLRRMTPADTQWLAGASRLADGGLPPQQELQLRHALGKYHDDVGEYELAFGQHQRANLLAQRCGPVHRRDLLTREVERVLQSLDAGWFSRMTGVGCDSRRPVFIVGMLRSGTTLAEQILAAHPAVFGAGELSWWGKAWTRLASAPAGTGGPRVEVPAQTLRTLADGYLAQLQSLAGDAACVVDKMPTNFLVLGLIAAALPQARFIHLRRDPRDTCLSIYFQHFEAANTYANDLGDLAHYALLYRRLMRHWRALLPSVNLLEVDYEDLVTDTAGCAQRMVAFAGLPWDPGCLEFQRSGRSVVTASRWQVRQPVYRGAIGRWRHYERFIAPLQVLVDAPP